MEPIKRYTTRAEVLAAREAYVYAMDEERMTSTHVEVLRKRAVVLYPMPTETVPREEKLSTETYRINLTTGELEWTRLGSGWMIETEPGFLAMVKRLIANPTEEREVEE